MKYISPEGLKKIKEELKERETTKRQEIAQRLEEAKTLGDLSENTEYSAAKEAQAFNEGRILELKEIIKKATLIKPGKKNRKKVQMGSIIKVKLLGGKCQSFTIVGSQEAEPGRGKISNESPLGQAFLEHQVGDIIEAETPKKKVKYRIVAIR